MYDNCEATLDTKFELYRKPFATSNVAGGTMRKIVASETNCDCILQHAMFRADVREAIHYETKDSVPASLDRVRAFDGKTTRARQGLIANIIDGPARSNDLIRPHMLIVEMGTNSSVPLSVLL